MPVGIMELASEVFMGATEDDFWWCALEVECKGGESAGTDSMGSSGEERLSS